MIERVRTFREQLGRGPVLGPFAKTRDPDFIETMGLAGFDFVILDLEHGPAGVERLVDLIRAAELSGLAAIVRVKADNPAIIGEALDVGAAGVQVPQVGDAASAEAIVQAAKFAPVGQRGVCRFVRAAGFSSLDRFEYFRQANETLVIVQIEGQKGLDNLDGILAVRGIDVVFVGPYDLSQSLNLAGQTEHPRVLEKMKQIVARCAEKGMAVGTFVETPDGARKWADLGARYLAYSVDVGLFHEKCRNVVRACRVGSATA